MPASSGGLSCATDVIGPKVQIHCLDFFLRPANGVAGQLSLSSSSSDDSRFSPVWGEPTLGSSVIVFDAALCPLPASPSLPSFSGGDSSRVEMVEVDESMSEWLNVYFVVLISSASGARNATFFAAGNIGLDCANDIVRVRARGRGPLVRMEVTLNGSLYGISEDRESIVELEEIDAAEDEALSAVSAGSGSWMHEGVDGDSVGTATTSVARGVSVGFFGFVPDARSGFCAFRNVFLVVGDVAESVSNLKLVEPLPEIGATLDVFSDSFGLFEGEGMSSRGGWLYAIGAEGSMASDMVVPEPKDLGA